MTQSVKSRIQDFLRLAEKATPGPWSAATHKNNGRVYYESDGIIADTHATGDKQFIAASRTESEWLARQLLAAIEVLESIALDYKKGELTKESLAEVVENDTRLAREFLKELEGE